MCDATQDAMDTGLDEAKHDTPLRILIQPGQEPFLLTPKQASLSTLLQTCLLDPDHEEAITCPSIPSAQVLQCCHYLSLMQGTTQRPTTHGLKTMPIESQQFLRELQTGRITLQDLCRLTTAAHYFMIPPLEQLCALLLASHIRNQPYSATPLPLHQLVDIQL